MMTFQFSCFFPAKEKKKSFDDLYQMKNTFRRSVVARNTSTKRDKTWDLQFMGCYFLLLQMFFLVLLSTIWLLNYLEKIHNGCL